MEFHYQVIGFYNTSIGAILVVKLPNAQAILRNGVILTTSSNSRWRIKGSGMGKKPDWKNYDRDDLLIMDYTVEHLSGPGSLDESDVLFIV